MLQRAVLGDVVAVEDVERSTVVKAYTKKGCGDNIKVKLSLSVLLNVTMLHNFRNMLIVLDKICIYHIKCQELFSYQSMSSIPEVTNFCPLPSSLGIDCVGKGILLCALHLQTQVKEGVQ